MMKTVLFHSHSYSLEINWKCNCLLRNEETSKQFCYMFVVFIQTFAFKKLKYLQHFYKLSLFYLSGSDKLIFYVHDKITAIRLVIVRVL
jgi:hypothetical protein